MSATKALRAPSKIASALDWKRASGAILALDVGSKQIGLAIAAHPSFGEAPLPLEPLPLTLETRNNKRVLSREVSAQLERICASHNISSFVVSWPVEEKGRCGAACGKVLHTLDSLVDDSNVLTDSRPFCLWDPQHTEAPEDEWGRNPVYGVPAAREGVEKSRYHRDSSSAVAANVMRDFLRAQWPELAEQTQAPQPVSNTEVSVEWLEHYEDTEAYMTVAV